MSDLHSIVVREDGSRCGRVNRSNYSEFSSASLHTLRGKKVTSIIEMYFLAGVVCMEN